MPRIQSFSRRVLGLLQAVARNARWYRYKDVVWPGVHKYTLYWSLWEDTTAGPSPNPIDCPQGSLLVSTPSPLDEDLL